MAYFKKKSQFVKSRRGYKKKTYYKPKRVPMEALPKAVVPEMKRHSLTPISGTVMGTIDHAPLVQSVMTNIGAGTGEAQRIGNKIQARGLMLRGAFFNRNTNNKVLVARLAVIQDREATSITDFDGTQALVQANNNIDLSTLAEQACFLPWNKYRYRVLYDTTFKLSANQIQSGDYRTFKKFIKLNMPVLYGGTAGDSLKTKPLQVVMWATDPSDSAVNNENITAYCDTTFYYNDA